MHRQSPSPIYQLETNPKPSPEIHQQFKPSLLWTPWGVSRNTVTRQGAPLVPVLPLAEFLNIETPCSASLVPETPVTYPKDPYFPPLSSLTESLNNKIPSGASPAPVTTYAETPQSVNIETPADSPPCSRHVPWTFSLLLEIFPSSTEMSLNPTIPVLMTLVLSVLFAPYPLMMWFRRFSTQRVSTTLDFFNMIM